MRIGLYGMPTSGKSFILDQIDFIDVISGSKFLHEYDPAFDSRDSAGRELTRKKMAEFMMEKNTFIMDGHYAFGRETAFTEADGMLYDVFLYLYVSPEKIHDRMKASAKNNKYLNNDIGEWQRREVEGLREYCHNHNKDFYVIDNPPDNFFEDVSEIVCFIRDIVDGYSCMQYARYCIDDILQKCHSDTIVLFDGDKTLTMEDSSRAVFGYKTHLYDGNFYTGYQSWKQNRDFNKYHFRELTRIPVHLNGMVSAALTDDSFILTSGHEKIWRYISGQLGVSAYYGSEMSAETKLYITKGLQDAGKYVVAYGDGMNDYYMLKQADEGYLVTKPDGSISRSLKGQNLEGLTVV